MMFVVMVNFYGAITFYYFITNLIQIIQQKYIFDIDKKELEEVASEKTNKKIKNAKEAKIIKSDNKSSGNIRRIKAKDSRRKK